MTAIGPRLREWVVLWREAIPEFTVDSLRFAGWSEFRPAADADPWPVPGYVVDSMHDRGDVRNTAALVIPGPGGRYVLLVDRYQMVTEESAGIEIGGEPESAPVLLDRGTGQTRSFEFCGTPCAYHWGAWIDSARFVLGGWSETDSRGLDKYGTLGYYDLRRGLKASYLVPATESGRSAAYYAAWREWLISRYRRLPRS